jgi:hypothetical protein
MAERETQMRDGRFEIVLETGYRLRQISGVGRCDVVVQQARERG